MIDKYDEMALEIMRKHFPPSVPMAPWLKEAVAAALRSAAQQAREDEREATGGGFGPHEPVLIEVAVERARQDEKWGEQHHKLPMWCAILMEEVGEVAKEALSDEYGVSLSDRAACRMELVQTAAVAVAMIEFIDRRARKEASE